MSKLVKIKRKNPLRVHAAKSQVSLKNVDVNERLGKWGSTTNAMKLSHLGKGNLNKQDLDQKRKRLPKNKLLTSTNSITNKLIASLIQFTIP